jgi:thermostable 8-oxoguanine DNA glycosylase
MIDPFNITNYERTEEELEEFLFFCVFVAGKTAPVIAEKTDDFYRAVKKYLHDPLLDDFDKIKALVHHANRVKLGKYSVFQRFFREYVECKPNLRTVTVEELMRFTGVGPKTARFFVLHSRKDAYIAVLDTHILRYMREFYGFDTPRQTPQSKSRYEYLEGEFLGLFESTVFDSVAEFDLYIWKRMRNYDDEINTNNFS